jgi:hypothetical protein
MPISAMRSAALPRNCHSATVIAKVDMSEFSPFYTLASV